MKKYLIIGNPVEHSLSPTIHNLWFKKNKIDAMYEKSLIEENEISNVVKNLRLGKIDGMNVTVPFKKKVISFLDELTPLAKEANSVNTVFKKNNKIIGDNTDIPGFQLALKKINFPVKNKKALILGAGGVAPSLIIALKQLGISNILLTNRTKEKALELKKEFDTLEVIDWGTLPTDCDLIINGTSLGLNSTDKIDLDFSKIKNKILFYDVIYKPNQTQFLKDAKKNDNNIENGLMMFLYQAQLAFKIWNNILPEIDEEIIRILKK